MSFLRKVKQKLDAFDVWAPKHPFICLSVAIPLWVATVIALN